MNARRPIASLLICLAMSIPAPAEASAAPSIASQPWGRTSQGEPVRLFTLRNSHGMEARILEYGGILVSLTAPDKDGTMADVVLGFDTLAAYLRKNPFFGCITGRYANRIGGAAFELDGKVRAVTANSKKHHLHGGAEGFDKKLWLAEPKETPDGPALILRYTSPAGEEGYPGQLDCTVTYTLTEKNELVLDYQAVTDAPTIVNLTNHSYFNLAGEGSGTVLGHELRLQADSFTATDDDLIPTGEIRPVAGTPLDFTQPHALGERIGADFGPLKQGQGYDHNFIVQGKGLRSAATLRDPASCRTMEVLTTEPGIQIYTANHLNGVQGKSGHTYGARDAVCLETQHYPDSPNKPAFPSPVLRPGETYHTTTILRFTAR